jgi:hypothetical protein
MKYRYWIWLLIGALPLPIYPLLLFINMMSLGGAMALWSKSWAHFLTANGFLWGSSLYPLVYVRCFREASSKARRADYRAAINVAILPVLYLAAVLGLFCGVTMLNPEH